MRILGSVYFAIALITLTLLFVITGTLLESWSGSHLYAAYFTYNSPVFQLLLWLYFVNIATATLNRYPFKPRHIPFIITHLGLLMILGGVLMKSHFGVQGAMGIAEGARAQHILLPQSHALLIETRDERRLLPLSREMETTGLSIKLLEWQEHAEERLEGFIKGEWGHLVGLPAFPLDGAPVETTHYAIQAVRGTPESVVFPGRAALFFVQNEDEEHLVAFNKEGARYQGALEKGAFYIFDKGFGGYGVFATLPEDFPQVELLAPLTRHSEAIKPHRKREELTPRVRLLVSDERESEVVTLTYDRYGAGFKWPVLGGKYLVRFQSMEERIPFPVRLRSARQINYPGSEKPYSFESDILVDGEEATLSMNHVYERAGYRFYLANLVTPSEGATRAQIVVNYDPAKYVLTYPGGIILALGMLLLYLQRRCA